jgi:hypothetical protein
MAPPFVQISCGTTGSGTSEESDADHALYGLTAEGRVWIWGDEDHLRTAGWREISHDVREKKPSDAGG